ncbi:hypothetical protein AGR8A_pTi10026 [Agrobacterium fabrum str. J-07]|nr:hypothetical protein AGR8A_pTi10026 [Agrobacterium fabrum str. J-07]
MPGHRSPHPDCIRCRRAHCPGYGASAWRGRAVRWFLPLQLRPQRSSGASAAGRLRENASSCQGSSFTCELADGIDDVLIARAATNVPGERFPDLVVTLQRVVAQKIGDRHDEAWGTEAALKAVVLAKRFLDAPESVDASLALDRFDHHPLRLHGECEARASATSVKQDSARSAYTVLATDMSTCKAQLVTKKIAEEHTGLDGARVR